MLNKKTSLGIIAGLLMSVSLAEVARCEEARPAKISFLHQWTEKPERKRYLDEVAELFNKKHRDITVNMVGVGVAEVETMLMSRIAAGNPPDMVVCGNDVTRYLRLNIPLDLTPWFMADDEAWIKTFRPGMKQFITHVDDRMYVVPIYLNATPLNYHKDAIAKTGMPLPKTKEEFYALLDKLKELGYRPPFELHASMIPHMLDIFVLDYASRDGVSPKDIAAGRIPFNSKFVVDSLENFKEMYVKEYFPRNFYSLQGTEGRMKYSTGVMATKMGLFWDVYTHYEFGMPFENQGVAPFPNLSGAKEIWHPAFTNASLVIRSTRYPEACIEFLKFLTSKEMQGKLVDSIGNKDIGYPLANRFAPKMSNYAAAYAADLEHATPYGLMGFDPELMQAFQGKIRSLVKGKISSRDLADELEAMRVRILGQREQPGSKKKQE